jgi:hypothetical protein
VVSAGQVKLRNGVEVVIVDDPPSAGEDAPASNPDWDSDSDLNRPGTKTEQGHRNEVHRHLHPPAGARQRRQPADLRPRPARLRRDGGAPVPGDPEHRGHHHHGLSGRQQRTGQGLHHHAAATGGRGGERHRLSDRHQQPGRVGDRGQHAPQLRPQRRGRGDPGQGREPAQRAAGGGAEPGHRLHHRRLHGADVPGLLQPRHGPAADHRLSDPRGPAAAPGARGRRQGRADRQPDLRHARLAGPGPDGIARRLRRRCLRGAGGQQLPGRHRPTARRSGPDGPHHHHRRQRRGGFSATWWSAPKTAR